MAISWLLNSVEKGIANSLLYCSNAKDLWNKLESRFEQSNGTQLFQLQKELPSISQGSSSIAAYYTRIKKVWDELSNLYYLPPCSCGAASQIIQFQQEQRLIQFLMGLNESYVTIRGNILMMKPLPKVTRFYAILVQEERQREVTFNVHFISENSSFLASADKSKGNMSRSVYEAKNGNRRVECRYCKKPGHTIDKCYKLHGYPSNFTYG